MHTYTRHTTQCERNVLLSCLSTYTTLCGVRYFHLSVCRLVDALEKVGSNLGGSANISRDNFQVISMQVDPDTVVEDVEVETKDAMVDIPPVVIKQMGGGSPATVSVFEIRAPAVFGRVDPVSSPIVGINLGSIRDLLSPIQIHFSNVRTVSLLQEIYMLYTI